MVFCGLKNKKIISKISFFIIENGDSQPRRVLFQVFILKVIFLEFFGSCSKLFNSALLLFIYLKNPQSVVQEKIK